VSISKVKRWQSLFSTSS